MKINNLFFLFSINAFLFVVITIHFSCKNISNKNKTLISNDSIDNISSLPPGNYSAGSVEVKTYVINNPEGKLKGWGFDIYINNKKRIHQPNIPAVSGNKSFKSEEDAKKTGMFMANKMLKGESFPTILIKELDSLGVL